MNMQNDVLEPFVQEWAERARLMQAAIDRLGGAHHAPRIERQEDRKGNSRYVLIRRDGDRSRIEKGQTARAVTIRFTPDEWAMIERVILLRHGLAIADTGKDTQ